MRSSSAQWISMKLMSYTRARLHTRMQHIVTEALKFFLFVFDKINPRSLRQGEMDEKRHRMEDH